MNNRYDIVREMTVIPPLFVICRNRGREGAHELMHLRPTVQKMSNRLEIELHLGPRMNVCLMPEIDQLYAFLSQYDKDLIVVRFDHAINDTVVHYTSRLSMDSEGITFERVGDDIYRLHIGVIGQFIIVTVKQSGFLAALEAMGAGGRISWRVDESDQETYNE